MTSARLGAGADAAGGLRGPHTRVLVAGISATWATEIMRLRLSCVGIVPLSCLAPAPRASGATPHSCTSALRSRSFPVDARPPNLTTTALRVKSRETREYTSFPEFTKQKPHHFHTGEWGSIKSGRDSR